MGWQDDLKLLSQGVAEVIAVEELGAKLKRAETEGRSLRIKLGLDPTAPDIHIGHTVVLRKLRQFQDLGHEAYLIIGDFTGRIGDPSGRSETRKQLTQAEIMANAKTYEEQFAKVLDPDKTRLVFNSNWFKEWSTEDFIRLTSRYTVARMLERDDFEQRYREGRPISIVEFIYPLLQGYDSVAIKADVELGGTDQKFNLLLGRQLQREYQQEPQVLMLMPLLEGTDGVQKMSKSLGNYIGINEAPGEIYGKTMSISDRLIVQYLQLATDFKPAEIEQIAGKLKDGGANPMEVKKLLARRLVTLYHGERQAEEAAAEFQRVFSKGEVPEAMPTVEVRPAWLSGEGEIRLIHLLRQAGLVASNSEARRMIQQGAVYLEGERVKDIDYAFVPTDGLIIKVGKRRFARIQI